MLAAGRMASSAVFEDRLNVSRLRTTLSALRPESAALTRGAHDVALYRQASPSVVLIVSENGLGTGSLISADGTIVTNYHVVGNAKEVGVIFKPIQEGAEITKADLVRARVVRFDQVADLALLRATIVPSSARVLQFGSLGALSVGSDVHAIGHPTGEAWTYTRGIVSQIRKNYQWTTESGFEHRASVIQTQTPINPGNSGGPLLDDAGQLVGVNSFKGQGEGLNFAVSLEDVQKFLAGQGNRLASQAKSDRPPVPASSCEPKELGRERVTNPPGVGVALDIDCDGNPDGVMLVPDDSSKPFIILVDENGDGEVDTWLIDVGRDGEIEKAIYDSDDDGEPDMVGYFRSGEQEPYRFEPFKS